MRSDLRHKSYLRQQGKLPGPGSYSQLDTIGASVINSTIHSSRKSSVPRAHDRWKAPTFGVKSPSPAMYSPKAGIGADVSSR